MLTGVLSYCSTISSAPNALTAISLHRQEKSEWYAFINCYEQIIKLDKAHASHTYFCRGLWAFIRNSHASRRDVYGFVETLIHTVCVTGSPPYFMENSRVNPELMTLIGRCLRKDVDKICISKQRRYVSNKCQGAEATHFKVKVHYGI